FDLAFKNLLYEIVTFINQEYFSAFGECEEQCQDHLQCSKMMELNKLLQTIQMIKRKTIYVFNHLIELYYLVSKIKDFVEKICYFDNNFNPFKKFGKKYEIGDLEKFGKKYEIGDLFKLCK